MTALIPVLWWIQRRYSLVDISLFQRSLSLFTRCLMLFCLALAMAGLSSLNYSQRLALVVIVDVSPSVPDEALSEVQKYLDHLWEQRETRDWLSVISFAESSRLLPSAAHKAPKIARHADELATDLQSALRHAYGLFPTRCLRRILLISDGNETQGNALEEVQRARAMDIRVDIRAIRGPYPPEVLIKGIDIPDNIRLNAPFELTVEIFSTYSSKKTIPLSVYKDGYIFANRRIELQRGVQRFRFPVRIDQPGVTSFQALINPKQDRFRGNNAYTRIIPIKGPPRILYLEGDMGKSRYLASALRQHKILVDVRTAYGIPTNLSDLERYDLILLSDIPAYQVSTRQMQLMEAYVRDLGGGLIMVGGENSFGPGGYHHTRLEKLLPVQFDVQKKQDTPSLALVLVIDKSGSMSGARIELAREAAKATVQMLGHNDQIGIVAFDYNPHEIVSLQSASNKSRIIYDISRIHASGGTRISSALEMSYRILSGSRAKVKHVILLSDGIDSPRGIFEIVQAMHAERITVSSICLGDGCDRKLLQSIADSGGGRGYFTNDPYNVPRLFTQETAQITRSSFVEEPFRPRVYKYSQSIKGIDFTKSPFLLGYVSTKAKPKSQVILSTELGEPLLVSWQRGLGKVVAFTSDVKNRWATNWLRWKGFGQFWAQVIRSNMRQRPSREFHTTASISEGLGKIKVDATDAQGLFMDYLDAKAIILDPKLKAHNIDLRQTAPGFYEGSFPATIHGAYLIKSRFYNKKQFMGMGEASASYAYPSEWLSTQPDIPKLRALALANRGNFDPTPAQAWHRDKHERLLTHQPLWPYLVLLVIGLLMVDIFLRRVRIFGRREVLN
jgi:uncharacterized membrane protein